MVTVLCVRCENFNESGQVGRRFVFDNNNSGQHEAREFRGASVEEALAAIDADVGVMDNPNSGQFPGSAELFCQNVIIAWSVKTQARRNNPALTNNKRATLDLTRAADPLRFG